MTEADVLEWLRVCFDPELPVNIVDLGFINRVAVGNDDRAVGDETRYRVLIEVTMRAPNEEREAMLLGQISNRLAGIRQISRAEVAITWEPSWTAERMSPSARRQLGLDRPSSDGLVQIRL